MSIIVRTTTMMVNRSIERRARIACAARCLFLLVVVSFCAEIAQSQTWWDVNWQYRKQITVTAGATAVPSGYAVSSQFDHAALVTAAKSLASGNDVRVLYWNGSIWTQLDRVLDDGSGWNSTGTTVWFRTQAAISASGSDGNYYLYYGYPTAGSPPANAMNVFLFHDTFPGGSLDGTKWTTLAGSPAVSGSILTLPSNGRIASIAGYAFGVNTRWEARIQLGGDGTQQYFNYWGATNNTTGTGYSDDYITFWTDLSNHYAENSNSGFGGAVSSTFTATTPTTYHTYTFNREGTANVRYFQDVTQKANLNAGIPTTALRVYIFNDGAGFNQLVDWVRVRDYVSPEPTTSLGVEATSYTISGKVFEDLNYGGGAGRNWTTASGNGGSARSGVRVELFDNAGSFLTSTTTDGSGNYIFGGLPAGTYHVRAVSDSVSSSRTGYTTSLKSVMTFRTNAATGTAVAVTDYVGGLDPATADATRALSGWVLNTTTGVFGGSGSGKASAFSQATITAASITGVDFGFNFNTIVNTNNSGQGSLRQFITNANALSNTGLAQSGRTAGIDNAIWMISNGTASAGLRSSINYFSAGVATISPTSPLPAINQAAIIDAQTQPGWTSAPIVELNGTGAGAGVNGLNITAGGSTVRGLIINRFSAAGLQINGANAIVAGNWIGLDAGGTLDRGNTLDGITISANNATIGGTAAADRNVVSGNDDEGIDIDPTITGVVIKGNYIGTNWNGTAAVGNGVGGGSQGGILAEGVGTQIGGSLANEGNLISGNTNDGIYLTGTNNVIEGNKIGTDAGGTVAIPNSGPGVVILTAFGGTNNRVGGGSAGQGNTIAFNTGGGIRLAAGSVTGNLLSGNSTFSNTGLGIDLNADGLTANDGAKSAGQPNLLMDHPVFTSALVNGTTLTVAGYVGSAPGQSTFANARVEIFKSDNDGSGYGEGQTYYGFLTADGSGNFAGSVTVSGLSLGDKITGTATDGSNNTSEFGANFTVTGVYYSKGSLAVNTPANWNTARNGTGSDATSFSANNIWVVQNSHSMTLSGAATWNVTASGTVQIENGGTWTNSSSGAVTIGTFQVDNGGTYVHTSGNTLPGTVKTFGATSTVTYAGGTQTVAIATYGHLIVSAAGTKTLAGNVSVAGNLTVSAGILDLVGFTANRSAAGGTLTVSNGATLRIGGTNSFPTNYSARALGATCTVEYNGTAQSVAGETYGHLTLSNGNTKTAAAAVTIVGNLTIAPTTTFAAGSYTHVVQGNWTNSGTFTAGTSTIQLTGSSASSITGATTFNVLEVNKSAGSTTVTLNNNVSSATLTLTQGTISTGPNAVTVTSDRTGNGLVIGTITRTHTFSAGPAYAFEGPYNTLTFASGGTLPTSVTVTTTLSSPGANGSMDPIDRNYDISQVGGSGFTYTLRLHYEDSEVSPPNFETSPPLKIWRRTSTGPDVWERKGATGNSTIDNWVEVSGMTETGVWSLSSTTVGTVTLTLSQDKTNPSPGEQVTYTIIYLNTGDGPATSTLINANAPVNTTYATGSVVLNGVGKTDAADADEVTVTGPTIAITLGGVSAGASGTITYRVVIN